MEDDRVTNKFVGAKRKIEKGNCWESVLVKGLSKIYLVNFN